MMHSANTLFPVIRPVSGADQRLKGRDKVKALSRLARSALMQSCEKSGLYLGALLKNEKGVPIPVDGVYWSLTHKSEMVGGVAALLPVGMDIETIRPVSGALLAKVAGRDEWRLVEGDRQVNFFRLWTAKEAVLKAVGKGMVGLSRCRVAAVLDETRMTLTFDGHRWPVAHFFFDGHVAALTAPHFSVSWVLS